jgi:hypothetical protein
MLASGRTIAKWDAKFSGTSELEVAMWIEDLHNSFRALRSARGFAITATSDERRHPWTNPSAQPRSELLDSVAISTR